MIFDPFESRMCRDVRNQIGHGFVKSVKQNNPVQFSKTVAAFSDVDLTEGCIVYIHDRKARLDEILKTMTTLPDGKNDFFQTAALLWRRSLFFEVHEWLEDHWQKATGDEKRCLQALIMAATVYELTFYQRTGPAKKLAAKALVLIKATRHIFPAPFEPDALALALSHPDLRLPIF